MLSSCNHTTVFITLLLVWTLTLASSNCVVNGELTSYGIGFYHGDTSILASTCMNEFNSVRNYVYPTYISESSKDSNFNATIRNEIQAMGTSSSNGNGNGRKLLRGSNKQQQRKLQSWCYSKCAKAPINWINAVGCRDECIKPNDDPPLDVMGGGDDEYYETMEDVIGGYDGTRGRDLESVISTYSTQMGNSENIMPGLGDTTVSQFYATVKVVLPSTDPCQSILLNMTYTILPLFITLEEAN